MTRKERVIKIVRAILENKREIYEYFKKDGNHQKAAYYMREILEWSSFEALLTDAHYLDKLEKIYIEGNENE